MANVLKVQEQEAVQSLARRNWSIRRIARELNLDRKTVRRYVRAIPSEAKSPGASTPGSEQPSWQNPPLPTPGKNAASELVAEALEVCLGRSSLCEAHADHIQAKLEAGLTAKRIHQDLASEKGFVGSYQSVKRYVRGEDGRRRRCWILRMVLSYSRKAYSEAVFHQTTENFIRCLENGFRTFGGASRTVNLDNLRAAVKQADWVDPELNPKLMAFCAHYGTALMPCRPRTPKHKGKTENGIGYIKSNALKGRTFSGLAPVNEFLRNWESTVADLRIHGTHRQQVAKRFEEEKPALLPLPPDLFPCFQEAKRSVHRDSYVEVAKSYYHVPPEYIGREVWTRWDTREVRVFNQRWEQIALHRRLEPGQFTRTLGLGGGNGSLQRQLDYWLERCRSLGHPCGQWAQGLLERKGPIAIRSFMALVRLTEQHSFKAVNTACAAALSQGAWRLRDLRQLVQKHQVQLHFQFAQNHPLIRDLADYGLFIQTKQHE
jgi:transposase